MRQAVLLAAAMTLGCSGTNTEGRIDPGFAPSGAEFRPVAQVLLERCGSLDCHGSKYRNMRLYGYASQRLDWTHKPDAPDTTPEEVDQDYAAVVSLEPKVMVQVLSEGGFNPLRLTFFRKARGYEAHKGGTRILPGEPADRCIASWLAGTVDQAACRDAVPRLREP
jgi:hypothetical protein